MNRDDFLETVKDGISAAYFPAARAERPPAPPAASFDPAALVEQFSAEVTALKGDVFRAADPAAALAIIAELMAQHRATEFFAWDDAHLPVPNLRAQMAARGFSVREMPIPSEAAMRRELLLGASGVTVGISGAQAAIADTGTLVILTGAGKGRLASLMPPVHIALVRVADLYPSLMAFIAAHPSAARDTANLNFISGPSRTADIEQTLTLGVHGPKFVHIILVD